MASTREEQLDGYLRGQLSGDELEQFKLELKSNPDMATEFELQEKIIKGIGTYVHRDIRGKLKGFQKDWYTRQEKSTPTPAASPKRRRLMYPLIAVAATFLIAVTALFWLNQKASTSSTELYAAYYQPYAALSTSRDNSGETQTMQANDFYKNKEYDKALPIFEKLLDEKANNSKLLLVSGICQMELGKFDVASQYFQKIINSNDLYLTGQATWYAALCELKQNNVKQTKVLLQQLLAEPKGDRKMEAAKLLDELK